MQPIEQLIQGNFYHIYNRGINSCNLFNEAPNYIHFLKLYDTYILPVAETFAWVLMPNHFHFLVKIKENVIYKYSITDRSINAFRFFEEHKWETITPPDLSACEAPDSVKAGTNPENIKIPKPHLHFSHLFNAYSSYINKRYNRHGSLFERTFKRKLIDNETYLKNVVLYIHNNPVHHGFCKHLLEYPWSSYLSCISAEPTSINHEKITEWFGSEENYKLAHNSIQEIKGIEDYLGI
ncbi:MAG: hypothetical protein WC780_10680 [Lentimicrobiaceae bacterium]|jgi:REP element-mobilizing transposase RayT